MGLEEYQEKRDFQRSPEPPARRDESQGPLIFVVQKHRARQLHYDFRLELDGVLKSWSVPKGPSLDPEDKRLAVMVEDHPLEYASFEGAIPKGEYGAGEVIVWDSGTYSPDESGKFLFHDRRAADLHLRRGLEEGKLSIFLRGHKLRGSWALVKIQNREKEWLLIKHRDEYASPGSDILKEDRSVLSGLSVEEIQAKRQPDGSPMLTLNPRDIPGARAAAFPSAIAPMLAGVADKPFSHLDWIFEPKLDGYRIIASLRDGKVTLLSRRGSDVTGQYPTLVPELSRLPASEVLLDGELIALDKKGRQCFQCLQQYSRALGRAESGETAQFPLVYYVFDILYLDGYDPRDASLLSRKQLLHAILRPTAQVHLVDYFRTDGETVYRAALENGLEGVIAKEKDSKYESGRRSSHWLKVKAMLSDDFVIAGYSVAVTGRTQTFSSLLLGYYDARGRLVFAGHVGTGFEEQTLTALRAQLDALSTDSCPFAELPTLNALTTWVRPELVAEIRFSGWTIDNRLRIPVFVRLRQDKAAAETRRSEPVTIPSPSKGTGRDEVAGVVQQLRNPEDSFTIDVEGNKIRLNNMGKVLWPETVSHPGLTKRDLLEYLARVSPYMLPHLEDRPLTLTRYPDGIAGGHFYQKHWSGTIPDFVRQVDVREKHFVRDYLVCDNLSTLLWLGQIANIEFHTWFSRIGAGDDMKDKDGAGDPLDYPDFIIFDLDPFIYSGQEAAGAEPELNREGFARVSQAALWLKEVLDELSLNAFVKTSGKTGLHIHVPIARNLNYRAARSVAETIGAFLVGKHPRDMTTEWAQDKRAGKVFIDYAQNVRTKTLASAYSPRPTPEATVSTPLGWEELGKVYPTDFTLLTVPKRLTKTGDLWADILSAKKNVNEVLRTK